MKKDSYEVLENKRKLALECFMAYLDFAMNKENDWKIDSKMILKYGLIAELMFNYFRNAKVQNQYADALIEEIKNVSDKMHVKYRQRYKETYDNEVIGSSVAVVTVNKILNNIPVKKNDIMNSFVDIKSDTLLNDYISEKFKGIDVLNLLEIVYNKFPEKIPNEKVR